MCTMKWKEVVPEQDDWEKQIDIVAYYGSITVGSIVYCGEEIGWQSVIDILEEHCTDQINYYKELQGDILKN